MIKLRENGAGHWVLRIAAVVLLLAVVWWIPHNSETARVSQLADAFALIIAAMSLNLVFGYTGLISIGHSAFFGIGGYTTAILVKDHGWSPGWTFYAAAVIAFVVGCIVALPALRIKGIYLALVTLAVAVLFPQLMKWKKLAWLTEGARGIDSIRYEEIPTWPIIGELKGREGRAEFAYWLAFVVLVICYFVCRGIVKSRVGRSLIAIRDNETAAAVMGVNLAATKTLVFGVSAAMTALAGSLATLRTGVITPDDRYVTLIGSIIFFLVMVIGGAGSLWGPVLGGLLYIWLDEVTRSAGASGEGVIGSTIDFFFGWADQSPAMFILAVGLIALMFVAPYGLLGLLKRLSRRFVVVVPTPVGAPPSVLAAQPPPVQVSQLSTKDSQGEIE
ncbi:MAG: branched-chain amino acid ABC transporter permease [Actinomycetota bacterium]|nr:MAG: branched-chain amino acid ABC transporter permease [Actinomycetota bacterium]